jgi:hypothetical protein
MQFPTSRNYHIHWLMFGKHQRSLERLCAWAATGRSTATGLGCECGEPGDLQTGYFGLCGQVRHVEDTPGSIGGDRGVGEIEIATNMQIGCQFGYGGAIEVEISADMQIRRQQVH